MPQNTPMKRQFTTIDGRTVMSNLPQHWGGNDWAITGVDNPLPVGNYVQTEAGVWIPQKGSDDGAADVRLTGSIVENTQIRKSQVLVQRGIYNTNQSFFQLDVPNGARGVILQLGVGGVTGTFASGEGIRLEAGFTKHPGPNGHYIGVQTEVKSVPGTHAVFWYPGANAQDIKATTNNSSLSTIGLPLPDVIRARAIITGTFQTDEGLDIEFVADWIY